MAGPAVPHGAHAARALAWTCVLFDNVRAVSDAAAAERAATVCSVLDGSVTVGLHMDFLYR